MTDRGVVERYGRYLGRGGEPFARVGWGSAESQRRRFEILAGIGEPLAGTILDVGCGLGDLYLFLKDHAPGCDYLGVDIQPEMVAEARRRFPAAKFEVRDILDLEAPLPQYDYVLMSGAANLAQDRYPDFLSALIRRMLALVRTGVAFNLLSHRADFVEPGEVYGDPAAILSFCLALTRRVALRHDYMPHDFTVFLYPEP